MASIDLLEELKLHDFYPQKLSFSEAITFRGESQNGCYKRYGLEIVRKLLMFDSTAVVSVTTEINERLNNSEQSHRKLHPMDLLVVAMNCCDDFLRQVLVEKMFANKLCIPILLPDVRNGSYTLLLLALRSLVSEIQDKIREDSASLTDTLVDIKNPVVSFTRVGKLHRSKSKLANDLLNFNSFNTFFHRDCANGSAKRLVSNGSIEAAWYQSSTAAAEEQKFNCRFCTALNLRGDARDYPKQTQFLCQSSTLVVFMVDSFEPFKELYENVLKSVDVSQTKIIVCYISTEFIHVDDVTNFQLWEERCGHGVICADIYDWKYGHKLSDVDFTNDLRKVISKVFKRQGGHSNQMPTFVDVSRSGKNLGFSLDEDKIEYKSAKELADEFVKLVLKQPADCKAKILPLQGEPWEKIGKLEREQRRKPQDTSQDEKFFAEKETEKRGQREIQCRSLIQQNEITLKFSLKFHCLQDQTLLYYLNYCKIKLDARSRVITSNLLEEFKKKKQKTLPNEGEPEAKVSKKKLEIENSSFGLEHILRECGQIYEAVISEEFRMREELKKAPIPPDVIRNFPTIVARLLLMGQPLELMDGDASNVPITWLKAVLDQINIMTNNAKVFVLSIIGVQSSGKSTLLNALFGLQFPVSAGRCTNGIYCHLVPFDKESLIAVNDYIFVVDTEGLGASEFPGKSTFRDNELATFAIGLADATIINMKGENWAEMKDILQIAVHSLIRVRKTKAELELMPRCMFVHQNVSAVDAEETNWLDQENQLEQLDKAIKRAAHEEGFADITKFNQVIWYDQELHSWYFPDLWNGRPPKARISQDYTEKASEFRQYLVQVMKDNPSKLTISSFFLRMSDLWNAMLHNDFVLCFRNTQEIIASTVLNDKISIVVDIFKNRNKLVRRKVRRSIQSVTSIGKCSTEMEKELSNVSDDVEKNFADLKTTLQAVMDHTNLRPASRQQYEISLSKIKEEECLRSENEMSKDIKIHRRKLEYDEDQRVKDLKSRLADLEKRIVEVERDTLNEIEMKEFEESWQQLIADNKILVDERMEIAERKIKETIHVSIQELRSKEWNTVDTAKLFKTPFVFGMPQATEHDIVQNEKAHLLMDLVCSNSQVYKIKISLDDAFKKWERQFQNQRDLEFDASRLEDILLEVGQLLGIVKKEHDVRAEADEMCLVLPPGYSFTPDYTIRLIEFVCHYAYNRSLENSQRFIALADPLADIAERYLISVSCFQQISAESNISQQIFSYAERSFVRDLGELIKIEVCKESNENATFKNKRAFIRTILTELVLKTHSLTRANKGRQDIFKEFMLYFELADSEASENFFLDIILKFLKDMLIKDNASETDFQKMVKNNVGKVVEKAKDALRQANTDCKGCSREYIRIFKECMNVTSEFCFRINTSRGFTEAILVQIDNLYADFLSQANSSFERLVGEDNRAAIRTLFEKIMGCRERCPFCSAPCSQSLQQHPENHRANHYPMGVRGTIDCWGLFTNTEETHDATEEKQRKPRKLALSTCQAMVGTRVNIRTMVTVHKATKWYKKDCQPFKKYKEMDEYKDWDIPYCRDHKASLYWKWFMTQFVEELAEHYEALSPKIPEAWKKITWEEARESLNEHDFNFRLC